MGRFLWARHAGYTSSDYAHGLATAADGSVYVTGYFSKTVDFDPGPETFSLTALGTYDAFVWKLDGQGDFAWAARLGGTKYDFGYGIAVTPAGNVVTTGTFQGTADMDPGSGTSNLTSAGDYDVFVSVLDAAGAFVWARRLGGTGADYAYTVAAGTDGSVYTAGGFSEVADFDPGAGTFNLSSAGGTDAYVCRLDENGAFEMAVSWGGSYTDSARHISITADGSMHTIGTFTRIADFDPGPEVFLRTTEKLHKSLGYSSAFVNASGTYDAFVSKLDAAGNYVWAQQYGGTGSDYAKAIAVGADGSVYTAGSFAEVADFDRGAGVHELTSAGSSDAFIVKTDAAGSLTWVWQLGGADGEAANAVALGPGDSVYAIGYLSTGVTTPIDFDPGPEEFLLPDVDAMGVTHTFSPTPGQSLGGLDAGLVGTPPSFGFSLGIGSSGADEGKVVATDAAGNVYVTGTFRGPADFDPGSGQTILTGIGSSDVFVAKYTRMGVLVWAKQIAGPSYLYSRGMLVSDAGDVTLAGSYRDAVDFDPGPGELILESPSSATFVAHLDTDGELVWVRSMDADAPTDLATDSDGALYLAGSFNGTDEFDPGPGTFNLTSAGGAGCLCREVG